MDLFDTASEYWEEDRSEVMSAFLMRVSEFFCPSDRELALRGQIKTGWSTVAARKKAPPAHMRLPSQEIKHVEEVIAQADALQMAEEIRIGVQMYKLQRLRDSSRGNGTSSCILCGHDFAHHRSRSPVSMHFCHECAKAVCSRCKADYKCANGEIVILCKICNDERELWKKSGAWLSNKLPVIKISKTELERAQQQQQMQKLLPMRTDFVTPRFDEEDDETEDELASSISGSVTNFSGFLYHASSITSSRSPSPELAFVTEANPAAAAWNSESQYAYQNELRPENLGASFRLPKDKKQASVMRKSGSYDLVAIHRQRTSSMPQASRCSVVRKHAMSGDNKKDLEEMRRKALEKKTLAEQKSADPSRTPSPTLSQDGYPMTRSKSHDFSATRHQFSDATSVSPHPYAKIVQPNIVADGGKTPSLQLARHPQPKKPSQFEESPTPANKLAFHQKSSILPQQVEASVSVEPEKSPQLEKFPQPDFDPVSSGTYIEPIPSLEDNISPPVGLRRKPVPRPRKKQNVIDLQASLPRSSQEVDEFKRIISTPSEIKTVKREKSASLEREKKVNEFKVSTLERKKKRPEMHETADDEFKKVSTLKKTQAHEGDSKVDTSLPNPASVVPSDMSSEFDKVLLVRNQLEISSSFEEDATRSPGLKDIGKHTSITSEGSLDGAKETTSFTTTTSIASAASDEGAVLGDRRLKRQGARRVTHNKQPSSTPSNQPPIDADESSPRSRSRSGAVSGDEGAKIRRGHHIKRGLHSSPPQRQSKHAAEELGSIHSAEEMFRRRGGRRRDAKTGPDLLTAEDGWFGSIWLSLEYFAEEQQLQVTIHRCRGLRAMDSNGFSDPYIKLFLTPSPNKSQSYKTVVVHKTLNPEYNQMFTFFGVSAESLDNKALVVIAIDHDDIGKDDPLGGILVPLYEVIPGKRIRLQKLFDEPTKISKEITEEKENGQVQINFCYLGPTKILRVGVEKVAITTTTAGKHICPYITCVLDIAGTSMGLRSKIVKQSFVPVFNEIFEFQVEKSKLPFSVLKITVWNNKKIVKDAFLGEVILKGKAFWENVLSASLLSYEWYSLREHGTHSAD